MKRTKIKGTLKQKNFSDKKQAKVTETKNDISSTSKNLLVSDIENNIVCILKNENRLPANIIEQIKNIQKMRETNDAPVDTMGCHMLADYNSDLKV